MRLTTKSLYILYVITSFALYAADNKPFNVVCLGFGGRAQQLVQRSLNELEQNQIFKVVAVCDNQGPESLEFYMRSLVDRERNNDAKAFAQAMAGVKFYSDTQDGLRQLFENTKDVDGIIIASSNDRHLPHLKGALKFSSCDNILLEKPMFRNLQEFEEFNNEEFRKADINVGLVLRYTNMTQRASQLLAEHKNELGQLKAVRSHESVNFAHALTIIMMNWRKYRDQSGGLLLEKSVHDIDLALFFMQSVDQIPNKLTITTETSHEFFKKSRCQEIVNRLAEDKELRALADKWQYVPFQRVVPFYYNDTGAVDWSATVRALFKDFPEDDQLQQSNIIPDRHAIHAVIEMTNGSTVDFELKVKLNDFVKKTERGTRFTFEHGEVTIDIEEGVLRLTKSDNTTQEYLLHTSDKSMHAGGDVYVARTILGILPEGRVKASFNDMSAQLSTVMALVSEDQALRNSSAPKTVVANNGKWSIQDIE